MNRPFALKPGATHLALLVLVGLGVGAGLTRMCPAQTPAANPAGALSGTVRIDSATALPGQTLGPLTIQNFEATMRGHSTNEQNLGTPTIGQVINVPLLPTRVGQDNVITLNLKGAGQMQSTLTLYGQNATESAAGAQATFFVRNRAGGPQLMAASALYRRNLNYARAAAVPGAKRPQRFLVSDYVVGPGPSTQALEDVLSTMDLLGMNSLQLSGFGRLAPQIPAQAKAHGISHFAFAVYSPPQYFSWSDQAQSPDGWAQQQAKQITNAGETLQDVSLVKIAEEPTWYFPQVMSLLWKQPSTLARFRAYLQAQGLTPADVGSANWDVVIPVRDSEATTLPLRRLTYWTRRFYNEGATQGFKTWGDALRRSINANIIPTSDALPNGSRSYWVGPKSKNDSNPDAGMQWPFWMDVGRNAAPFGLWTEDWTGDNDAETWSYHSDIMRCAARLGTGNTFGGNIVARRIGDLGDAGGKYRALALTGHGGKALLWYNYGPEPFFSPYSWSDNQMAYRSIAVTNNLLAHAEDVLYPGQAGPSDIALLLPSTAYYWGKRDENPVYAGDIKGYYYALTHEHYPVDFVDETGVSQGELQKRGTRLLYVTAPNLTTASATAIKNWVQSGGTVVFSGPDVAGADEYDEPSHLLDAVRGVNSQARDQDANAEGNPAAQNVKFRDAQYGPREELRFIHNAGALQINGAQTVANFDGGGAAIAVNNYGKGRALSYGFRAGLAYFNSPKRSRTALPTGWGGNFRAAAVAAAKLINAQKPVLVSIPVIEAAKLDSNAGIAVTLLNWTGQRARNLQVTVKNAASMKSVELASGSPVSFRRQGNDLVATLDLPDADVLLLRR